MVLLGLLLATSCAPAEPPPPVCGLSRVLEAVQERLSRAGQPVALEAGSAMQAPGSRVDLVYCAVRTHSTFYDTPRLGRAPADAVQVYPYSLELRRNGIFLMP